MAKNKSIVICILAAVSISCCAQQSDIKKAVSKTYTSQIGVREATGRNDGKEVEIYLRYVSLPKGQPWCASFISWVYGQNNVANPRSGYCPDYFLAEHIIWKRNARANTEPATGDVWGLYFPEKGRIAHVGFVDQWGDKITITVEGNTNEAGSREGDGVYRKRRLTNQIYAVARYINY
jgi:hypothetical protein